MKRIILTVLVGSAALGSSTAFAQVKQTKEQIMFYTSEWKGERFPDGRPKVADNLLERALDVSIEDVWDYLRGQGYINQFEGGWQGLHTDKPFAGRALTAQFMPRRPDMASAVAAEGKAEGRVSGTNSWVINELQMGDTMVADGYGKIIEGTLIGSNLGSGIAAHTHSGFIFDAGIRDAEENREIANLNGFYRGLRSLGVGANAVDGDQRSDSHRPGRRVAGRSGAGQAGWRYLHSRNAGRGGHQQGRIHQSAGRLQLRVE